ncbi:hypothetical protein [Halobacillus aidingensis]|uniref:AAA domain-containing protein n=1 Tax=Halobacillus aidingensis TaxID=240303 RepID=A0A1H0S990_HALAD|nr:hypothetical protein [Halobacillus aidingensis]SDP38079.1 hypothetical protein SAMN05421677_11766 [Halobacillus aidingensis]
MSLKVRKLKLVINSQSKTFGNIIHFDDGLNVLRADNSSGKSTCVQSILYALGLESMISASHKTPLPHAMTDSIDIHGVSYKVTNSEVYLEIENGDNKILTVNRTVKGNNNNHLITVYDGPLLSGPLSSNISKSDYYVRESGAAKNPKGFHHLLARFIGWNMPEVLHYNGNSMLLYIECIMPLMFIEQKRGWSALQSNTPKQFGVRDVEKRALEFLLDLDAYNLYIRKQSLNDKLKEAKNEWSYLTRQIKSFVSNQGYVIDNLPKAPSEFNVIDSIKASYDSKLVSLDKLIEIKQEELEKRDHSQVPTVKEDISRIQSKINENSEQLVKEQYSYNQLLNELELEKHQLNHTKARLEAIKEDLEKYKDVRKLRRLGSSEKISFTKGLCPTCHQKVSNTLLLQLEDKNPMGIEESIQFLEGQKKTISFSKENSSRIVKYKEEELSRLRTIIKNIQKEIRDLKETLVTDERVPSTFEIKQRIYLKEEIKTLQLNREYIETLEEDLLEVLNNYNDNVIQIQNLPSDLLSDTDTQKIKQLESTFIKKATNYGLESVNPHSLTISRESYKPIHEGFDLQFDLSASDLIRHIWAYLLSLLQISEKYETNHLGLLIVDEPRQQSTAPESIRRFLQDAAKSKEDGHQIIFTSSETEKEMENLIGDITVNYINFDDKILGEYL